MGAHLLRACLAVVLSVAVNLLSSAAATSAGTTDAEAFDRLLKNLDKTQPAQQPPPKSVVSQTAPGNQLTASQIDIVREQLGRCWNIPAGARNLIVEISALLNPDGTVSQATIVDQARTNVDPVFRQAAESARRAFFNPNCTPLKLPPEKYGSWKALTVSFNATDKPAAAPAPLTPQAPTSIQTAHDAPHIQIDCENNPKYGWSIWVNITVSNWRSIASDAGIRDLLNQGRNAASSHLSQCPPSNANFFGPAHLETIGVRVSNSEFSPVFVGMSGNIIFATTSPTNSSWTFQENNVAMLIQRDNDRLAQEQAEREAKQRQAESQRAAAEATEKMKRALLAECGPTPKISGGPWFSSTYSVAANDMAHVMVVGDDHMLCIKTIEYISAAPNPFGGNAARGRFTGYGERDLLAKVIVRDFPY